METLNKVCDSIMDDPNFIFTSQELDIAIVEQTKKVMQFVVKVDVDETLLLMSIGFYYILQMTKAKSKHVERLKIGISSLFQKERFAKLNPQGFQIAEKTFDSLIANKLAR